MRHRPKKKKKNKLKKMKSGLKFFVELKKENTIKKCVNMCSEKEESQNKRKEDRIKK